MFYQLFHENLYTTNVMKFILKSQFCLKKMILTAYSRIHRTNWVNSSLVEKKNT